ncbi:MAG: lytic transglycosylase domain-containing protein [Chloroflexota bacterium]|nr:lytic transglycosylase domain-containing protein [Chloroflexota bacterium]
MKFSRTLLMLIITLGVLISPAQLVSGADEPEALSPYWSPRVRHWAEPIIQAAEQRGIDPDFLASLVWMESRGDSQAVGPVGAIGLMQIMPSEAGYSWRPTTAELLNPDTNLFWGTRTLATVLGQGEGDVFNALAAYNGGWEQIQYRGPKYFATTIMRDYAQAVAQQRGLQGRRWQAIFAVATPTIHGPIWVADAARDDVYFYGRQNWVPEGHPLIPTSLAPTAIVGRFKNENGEEQTIGLWYYYVAENVWLGQ